MQKLHKSDILRGAKQLDPYNPCVYFLINSGEIVYVGFSAFVVQRINSHRKNKKFDSYFVQKMLDPVEGLIFERYYIELFQPIYNIQYTDKPKKPQRKSKFTSMAVKSIVKSVELIVPCETINTIRLKPCKLGAKVSIGMYSKVKKGDNHYLVLNINGKMVSAEYFETLIYSFEGKNYKAKGYFGSIESLVFS